MRTQGDNGPQITICKKRELVKHSDGYKCGRCGQQKKIDGKSHICSNPKKDARKNKDLPIPNASEINVALQSIMQHSSYPFPGVYTAGHFDTDETTASDITLCVKCNKTGTHSAGNEDSFLECNTCNKKCIHYSCLEEFTIDWTCASCKDK